MCCECVCAVSVCVCVRACGACVWANRECAGTCVRPLSVACVALCLVYVSPGSFFSLLTCTQAVFSFSRARLKGRVCVPAGFFYCVGMCAFRVCALVYVCASVCML